MSSAVSSPQADLRPTARTVSNHSDTASNMPNEDTDLTAGQHTRQRANTGNLKVTWTNALTRL